MKAALNVQTLPASSKNSGCYFENRRILKSFSSHDELKACSFCLLGAPRDKASMRGCGWRDLQEQHTRSLGVFPKLRDLSLCFSSHGIQTGSLPLFLQVLFLFLKILKTFYWHIINNKFLQSKLTSVIHTQTKGECLLGPELHSSSPCPSQLLPPKCTRLTASTKY